MKLKLTLLALLFTVRILSSQSNKNTHHYQQIVEQTDDIYDILVKVRRDFHVNPEISKQEKRTSKIVAEYLRDLGLEVKTNIGGNGVVGILEGDKKGQKIAWRADMDAIKTDEPDVVSFASKNKGIRHICGHDIHTTIGLGIANVLSQQKENLEGTVYFIFQPAEETFTGAKDMIADGLFDMIKPDEIYGLHIGPEAAGTINYKSNELFAYTKTLNVKFKPNADEKELENFMNSILKGYVRNISQDGSPWDIINKISDPTIGLANKETIFKDYFILQGARLHKDADKSVTSYNASFLETDIRQVNSLPIKIKRQLLNSEFKDAFISIGYSKDYAGSPMNNPNLTKIAAQTIASFYNKEMIKPLYGQVPYFGEDFMFYQQKVPGVFFFLGGSNSEKGINAMPHSPNFAVDEKTIKYGVQCFASLIFERVNNGEIK
ncbi:M20 metallopeptidase family protein [Aquimarina intermedia]|uniref:Amidohydrolase n=1 Tax=Aquimarina intermedia TaxID=350814 RepID=A0A5S5C7X8_9FLAO|nr:amidohydrolase [Aquimarina intermedia]TYP75279.1 amidohydrolase [Aquimarina intermedia]